MSTTDLIIGERSRDIGDFLVGRLLPFRRKRMVGPYIFLDHMGPSEVGPGKYMDVGQHPHIGLSTLTYLFEGEVHHKDTTGADQIIRPGAVNLMTAGKGVVHTERTPEYMRDGGTYAFHGYQVWVALPPSHEEMEPEFFHASKEELPTWESSGLQFKLIVGKTFGKESPVPAFSPQFMLEVRADQQASFSAEDAGLKGEIGLAIVEGEIEACGQQVQKGELLVSKEPNRCAINIAAGSHLMVFGGEPFAQDHHIMWNLVASDKDRLEKAKSKWQKGEFPSIEWDNSYIPWP